MFTDKTRSSSLEDQIIRNIFRVYPLLRNRILKARDIAHDTEIQLPHAQILLTLEDQDSLSVTQLSQHTGIAMPNITPIIDKLCALQYVERHHSKNDRRMVEISILPDGINCIERIRNVICEQIFHQDSEFTDVQLTRLNDALLTILKYFPIDS